MATAEQIRAAVDTYVACLSSGDTEGIVALYAEDAAVEDPFGTPVHRG